jgi:signal transduction histidine kinase
MSSANANPMMRTAAWRISLWATLAFAVGSLAVFILLHQFVANDIQRRTDAWLAGEVDVLGDVAERTPKDRLYSRVVSEVAELASREVPNRSPGQGIDSDSVFFLQAGPRGPMLWVGGADGAQAWTAIRASGTTLELPHDVRLQGFRIPFRVASARIADGTQIYLGLSERDQRRVLRGLRVRFLSLWLLIVLLGSVIVFYTTRRMLNHVRRITEAASRIGESDLSSRVPVSGRNDEVGHLGRTLNHMLDRIESTVNQLRTITDSLAHDLRSPLTAIRGTLEVALSREQAEDHVEPIVMAIEELDRLTEFLNSTLDVAEANADALRLTRTEVDLDQLLRTMLDLYEPCMSEKGLRVHLRSAGLVSVLADSSLLHRLIANLLDNELKHLPAASTIQLALRMEESDAILLLEDDGPGIDPAILAEVLKPRVRGKRSGGHGLGLAFIEAVVRAHRGSVLVENRESGGIRIKLTWPLAAKAPDLVDRHLQFV